MTASLAPRFPFRRRWSALAGRAARTRVVAPGPLWRAAAESALGRPLGADARLTVVPVRATRDKAALVVADGGDAVLVRVLADDWRPEWLDAEHDTLDALRQCLILDPQALASLPAPPLFQGR